MFGQNAAILLEFMYLVFTRTPCDSCRSRFGSLLLCQTLVVRGTSVKHSHHLCALSYSRNNASNFTQYAPGLNSKVHSWKNPENFHKEKWEKKDKSKAKERKASSVRYGWLATSTIVPDQAYSLSSSVEGGGFGSSQAFLVIWRSYNSLCAVAGGKKCQDISEALKAKKGKEEHREAHNWILSDRQGVLKGHDRESESTTPAMLIRATGRAEMHVMQMNFVCWRRRVERRILACTYLSVSSVHFA